VEVSGGGAQVEVGEGIRATCKLSQPKREDATRASGAGTDVASLSSMLAARWKGGAVAESSKPQEIQSGQVRKFRITKLDLAAKKIEVELV
jgi:small subunit ribosomal protein S1